MDIIGFSFLHCVIHQEISRLLFDQSEREPKPMTMWSQALSRALSRLALGDIYPILIGRPGCYSLVLRHFIGKRLRIYLTLGLL